MTSSLWARLSYTVGRALRALREGLFGAITITCTIALALSAVGTLYGVGRLLSAGLDQWSQGLRFSVLLADGCSETDRAGLIQRLQAAAPGAAPSFIPKSVALLEMRQSFGELGAVLDDLPENPLRDAIELPASRISGQRVTDLAASLHGQPCVEDVDFGAQWLGPAEKLLAALRWALGALFAIIAAVTLVLVSNTFQLAIYARREEIGILKLVGATDAFVRWPFLLEGLLEGLLGGALAGLTLGGAFRVLWPRALVLLPQLSALGGHPFSLLNAALWLVGVGGLLGVLASGLSVGRFLRV